MHSCRMRTGRSLTICCNLLPGGVLPAEGVSLVRGEGGSAWSRGGLLGPGGWGGSAWSQGGSPWSGGSPCSKGGCPETPPVDKITDTCKNITLATTSLRPVTKPQFEILCLYIINVYPSIVSSHPPPPPRISVQYQCSNHGYEVNNVI